MENNNENAAKSPLHLEEYEPSRRQFLKEKGRSNSPVVVYDCDQKTVQVRSKKDFAGEDNVQEFKFRARCKKVTLFVDEETDSRSTLTTASTAPSGTSNVLLAQLYLDRLGPIGNMLRLLGLLSTLYVMNAGPMSETSSQIGVQNVEASGC